MVYRPKRGPGRLLPLVFFVFAVVAVALVVATAGDKGPPVWFAVLWLGALGWNAYWWLFRVCVEVHVDGPTVEWFAPLRRGRAPLGDVTRIRASRVGRQLAVMELQGRRPVLVPVRYGFAQLQRAIAAGAPGAVIDES